MSTDFTHVNIQSRYERSSSGRQRPRRASRVCDELRHYPFRRASALVNQVARSTQHCCRVVYHRLHTLKNISELARCRSRIVTIANARDEGGPRSCARAQPADTVGGRVRARGRGFSL